MTASATAPTREKAERAREDCEYVRSLLNVRRPQFAAALEAAACKVLRDHGTVCASSQRISQPGWGLLGGAGRPAALPAGQTCELRVGPEGFYLGSDAGKLTVRRGTTPACTRPTRRITGSYSPATLCASSTMARRCCCLPAMLWCRTELATVGAWLETCRPPWLCSSSEPTGRRLARDQIAVRPPSAAKTAPVM